MKSYRRLALGSLASLVGTQTLLVATAGAQALAPTSSARPVFSNEGSAGEFAVVALVIVGLLVIIGVAVKLYDMKRKREDDAVGLQGRISDVLLTDRALSNLALTPLVEVPLRRDGLVTVTVSGSVPTPELHEAALELVMHTMEESGVSFRVVDHIVVDPTMRRRAA